MRALCEPLPGAATAATERPRTDGVDSDNPEAPCRRRAHTPKEDDLVSRLSKGEHLVESSLRPEKTVQALKERIDLGYVHIKFTETRGGTELGVRLDREALDLSQADFEGQKGTVHLEGELTLNYVKVRCIADINLQTLAGKGRLAPV